MREYKDRQGLQHCFYMSYLPKKHNSDKLIKINSFNLFSAN